jgi:aminoglycoside phosphotransferase family enzyme/predicted kinase
VDPAATVQATQTHISMLFFTADRAYKLLKPVHTGFLDHSTVERRCAAMTAELDLNRRLAPDVYLGTADLEEHGTLADRLLIMRRLPDERRLSTLIDDPDFLDHLRRIAHQIAAFHESLPPIREELPMTTPDGLLRLWTSSFEEIEPSVGSVIDADEFERVERLASHSLAFSGRLFERRRERGLVREGHGDLTADDIFVLDDGPRILDCLAFDRDLRVSDVLAGIAARRHRQTLDHLERARRRLVLIGGGPGSGKTTLARAVADTFNWSVIDSDTLRKDLRGIDHDDHDVEDHPDLYGEQATAATYRRLCEHAGLLLEAGESVIMDATWADPAQRDRARELASCYGADLYEIECRVDDELARQRVERRQQTPGDASDATVDIVEQFAHERQRWPSAHAVDTSEPLETSVDEVIRHVVERR